MPPLLLGLCLVIPRPSAAAENLLPNGSFEQGLQGWKIPPSEKMSTVSREQAATGGASLRVIDNDDKSGSQALSNPIPVVSGTTYGIGMKVFPVSGSGLGLYTRFFDNAGKQIDKAANPPIEAPSTPTGAWATVTEHITAPVGATAMDIWVHSYSASKVSAYVDDITVTVAEGTAATSAGAAGQTRTTNQSASRQSSVPILPIPAANEIVKRIKTSHPRVMATRDDFAALRQRIKQEPQLQQWATKLRTDAEVMLAAEPVKHEPENYRKMIVQAGVIADRINTLALLYQIDGDRKYVERAWRELESAASFPHWDPGHFLTTATLSAGFAVGYDWLYDVWTPEQRTVIRTALIEKGLKEGVIDFQGNAGDPGNYWTTASHNWNMVCNAGLGLGALAVADKAPEMSGALLRSILNSLPLSMRNFAPDGGWPEGMTYWRYSTISLVPFLAAMESAVGTDYGLSAIPGFERAGDFPIYLAGPADKSFNFGDSADAIPPGPHMYWLGHKFNQPSYLAYARKNTPPHVLSMLWWRSGDDKAEYTNLPLGKYFRGVETVTLRNDWKDPAATFVGFKGGENGWNHGHLDLGTWVMDALGERWVMNLGNDLYSLPGYFETNQGRWKYYRNRAEGHNTLVINPEAGPDQGTKSKARILRSSFQPQRSFAITDLTPAYAKHGVQAQRGIMLLGSHQVVVQDEIKSTKPVDMWSFIHTLAQVELDASARTAVLQLNGKKVTVQLLSPATAKFAIMPAKPLPTSPDPAGQHPNGRVRKLAVNLNSATEERISIVLTPQKENGAAIAPPPVTPLATW